jgi:pimeloyl-ACP methyl ester carboxylesterase
MNSVLKAGIAFVSAICVTLGFANSGYAQKIQMKDGRIFEGRFLLMTGVSDPPVAPPSSDDEKDAPATPILLIDNELTRTYIPRANIASIIDSAPVNLVKVEPWQRPTRSGNTLAAVGPSLRISPWDEFGRRIFEMQTRDGQLSVVQGITELTPHYAKVEGLLGPKRTVVWDMRIATSSIPKETLSAILKKAVPRDNPQDWLTIVRFYLQAERFADANKELQAIIKAFPDQKDLEAEAKQIRQMGARRILKEIQLRREAGQHQLVGHLLENYPTEDVPGDMLQQVREALANYQAEKNGMQIVAENVRKQYDALATDDTRALVKPIVDEITKNLNFNNVDRLLSFTQLFDDPSLTAEQKMALAISGWLLGQGEAIQDFGQAVPLVQVRDFVLEYLKEPLAHKRAALLESIRSVEGLNVPRVAAILAQLTPPWFDPKEGALGYGAYQLTAPGHTEHGDFKYFVQLPPEYDPYRRYPTLVVLNGAYNNPEQELDFWAGVQPKEQEKPTAARNGQAMRHGYITIAVEWLKPRQYSYEYSLREHEAVLTTLRDACRRFSIDLDRVFLSGHGIGGDAAWDMALAHPDLWAGAVPFLASIDRQDRFLQFYWENAEYVPLYFVQGELDGTKMTENAQLFDKYLGKRYDTTVIEYHGRGYEPFHDEILNIFDWLGRHKREWPTDFKCATMRDWDNYFWWIEGIGFSDTVMPGNWPKRGARPTMVEGRKLSGNSVRARTAAEQTIVWLRPDLVDFNKPMRIEINGKRVTADTSPSLDVLLEDARTRADFKRPFWARVEGP